MKSRLYRLKQGEMVAGVLNGLADSFDLDLNLIRVLFVLIAIFSGGGIVVAYIVFAVIVPYRAAIDLSKGNGSRKRKEAKPADDDFIW